MTNDTIAALQQRLDTLQRQIQQNGIVSTIPEPVKPYQQSADIDNIRSIVRKVLSEERAAANQQPAVAQVVQESEVNLLKIIGSILTEDEQLWFSDFKNLKDIPKFLPSFLSGDDGKLLLRTFADAYKEFKCK